jgi:hypothetical protein
MIPATKITTPKILIVLEAGISDIATLEKLSKIRVNYDHNLENAKFFQPPR